MEGSLTTINGGIARLTALQALEGIQKRLRASLTRLATGKRINQAADDPAALTIATKFNYRARALGVAVDNIGDARNMLAVAEGGLSMINTILTRMRDRAVQAASDTLGSRERQSIQSQLSDWTEEIEAIVNTTQWSGRKLLDGLADFDAGTLRLQVGADTGGADQLSLVGGKSGSFASVDPVSLGIGVASVDGGGGSSPDPASAILVSDPDGIVVGNSLKAPGPGNRNDIAQLSTGQYAVQVHRNKNQDNYFIQLLDSGNTALSVDPDGDPVTTPADAPKTKITGTKSGPRTVDFGTGLSLTVVVPDATGNYQAIVDYTAATSDPGSENGGSCAGFSGDVSTAAGAQAAIASLDSAIGVVSRRLQTTGTLAARLDMREHTTIVAKANMEAASSRILDADMAFEQLQVVKGQILAMTSTAMLSQANVAPQSILSLLGIGG